MTARDRVYLYTEDEAPEIAMLLHEYVTGKHYADVTPETKAAYINAAKRLRAVLIDVSREEIEPSL